MSSYTEKRNIQIETQQLAIMQQRAVFAPDEEIRAFVGVHKYSYLIGSLMGSCAFVGVLMYSYLFGLLTGFLYLPLFLQKRFLLVVTDRRLVLAYVPRFFIQRKDHYTFTEIPLPSQLELRLIQPPLLVHQFGNKFLLPKQFASFVGRPFAFVRSGQRAHEAFKIAAES
jgi:hypothetical protein